MKRTLACILLLTLILATASAAMAGAKDPAGAWSVRTTTKAIKPDKQALKALKQATKAHDGFDITALALLGSQCVNGTNYCFLCHGTTVTLKQKNSLCLVYVYAPASGKAEITGIVDVKLKKAPSCGWKLSKSRSEIACTDKAKKALKAATSDLVGATYKPLALLGRGKSGSSDYSLLCCRTYSDHSSTKSLCLVRVGKSSKSKYKIKDVSDLDIVKLAP